MQLFSLTYFFQFLQKTINSHKKINYIQQNTGYNTGSRESRDSTTSGGADSVVSTSTTGGGGGGTAAISAPTSPNDAHDGSGNGNGYNGVASSFIGRNPLLRGSKCKFRFVRFEIFFLFYEIFLVFFYLQ